MPGRASGFCVFNDPAVAAAVAVKEFGARVLYVDFDCHHGDGVQEIFYESPDVMTISFHESGRYLFPGTGFVEEIGRGPGRGFSLNVPMEPFTPDESWLQSVQAVLPPAVERFAPDLIISAHGADTHQWDPLTHISLTTRSFVEQVAITHGLAHEFAGGRWLAVGSGGYDWRRVVPRSWAIVWAEMTGRRALERLPAEWIGRWSPDAERPFPETLYDPGTSGRAAGDVAVSRANEATVKALQAAIGDRLRI
jgi:acetoin utilization protein AcuC